MALGSYDASNVGARPGRGASSLIDAHIIDSIKQRTDIAAVVGRHVELKRSGSNLAGLCPFHSEKSPSFIVTPHRGSYHCFGCGADGDAISFLREMEGGTFREIVEDLAQAAGIAIPETPTDAPRPPRPRRDEVETMTDAMAAAGAWYARQLQIALEAPGKSKVPAFAEMAGAYVRDKRGIDQRTIERFGIGLALPGWNNLREVFAASYDGNPLLLKVDLLRQREESSEAPRGAAPTAGNAGTAAPGRRGFGRPAVQAAAAPAQATASAPRRTGSAYETFRERLMFPVRNPAGKIVAFGGRKFDDANKDVAKYLNSSDTPIFHKSEILYGLYEGRQAIRREKYALVVEGYMDVVMLWQYGFENAVAAMGTACTESHLQSLLHFTDSVVFMFDGDAAGQKAARKTAETALGLVDGRHDIRILLLPDKADPDEFLRANGAEPLRALVQTARSLSIYLRDELALECRGMTTPEERTRYTMKFQALLKLMSPDNPLSKEYWKLFQGTLNAITGEGWQPRGTSPSSGMARAPSLGSQTSLISKLREAITVAPDAALDVRDEMLELLDPSDASERGLIGALERIGIDTSAVPAAPQSPEWQLARDLLASHATLLTNLRSEQLRAEYKRQKDAGELSLGDYLAALKSLA